MEDPKVIYLGPACQKEGDGREWCEDDVWTQCECGCSSVRYMLESDAQSELAALREELANVRENSTLLATLDDQTIKTLGERLKAAEQRNAELVELLKRAKPYIPWNRFGTVPYQWNLEVQDAIKPTESGASE